MADEMAHIGVRVQSIDGTVLAEMRDGGFELTRLLPDGDAVDYPYLRFIDPYDNTFFTSLQMSAVIPELRRLANGKPSPVLGRVLELAELCQRTMHSHLVFIGD